MKEIVVVSDGKREVAFPGFAVDTDTTVMQILTALVCLSEADVLHALSH
jgi:hypothetical protein